MGVFFFCFFVCGGGGGGGGGPMVSHLCLLAAVSRVS